MNYMQHMLYGSFGMQNSMVTIIFKFGLKKGLCQVILGHIRSNFGTQFFFLQKHACVVQFCLSFQNGQLLYVRQIEMPITCFRKVRRRLYLFYHCTGKNKWYCLDILNTCCLLIPFCGLKISDFMGINLWKIEILSFEGQNRIEQKSDITILQV